MVFDDFNLTVEELKERFKDKPDIQIGEPEDLNGTPMLQIVTPFLFDRRQLPPLNYQGLYMYYNHFSSAPDFFQQTDSPETQRLPQDPTAVKAYISENLEEVRSQLHQPEMSREEAFNALTAGVRKAKLKFSGIAAQQIERLTGEKPKGEIGMSHNDLASSFHSELTDFQAEKFSHLTDEKVSRISILKAKEGRFDVGIMLGEYDLWLINTKITGLEIPDNVSSLKYVDIQFQDSPFKGVLRTDPGMTLYFAKGDEVISFSTPFWSMTKPIERTPKIDL